MNKEKYQLLTKDFVGIDDIMKITELSRNKSRKLLKEIELDCKNILMPRFKIPTKKLIEKLNINVNEIYRKAEREIKLENASKKDGEIDEKTN